MQSGYELRLLIPLLASWGWVCAARCRLRIPSGPAVLAVCAGTLLSFLLAAAVGLLLPAAWVWAILGAGFALVFVAYPPIRPNRTVANELAWLGFAMGLVGLVLAPIYHDQLFRTWDTLAHWGLAWKEILYYGGLPPVDSVLGASAHPMAMASLLAGISSVGGASESTALLVQAWLTLIPLVVYCQPRSWCHLPRFVIWFGVALVAIHVFAQRLDCLLLDALIATWFACAIDAAARLPLSRRSTWLVLAPVCVALPLIKQVGAVLSAIVVLTVLLRLASTWLRRRGQAAQEGGTQYPAEGTKGAFRVALAWTLVTGVLAAAAMPAWHLARTLNARSAQSIVYRPVETDPRMIREPGFHRSLWRHYSQNLLSRRILFADIKGIPALRAAIGGNAAPDSATIPKHRGLSAIGTVGLLNLFFCCCLAVIRCHGRRTQSIFFGHLGLLVGWPAYVLFFYLVYAYVFIPHEGRHLAQFNRYQPAYLLSWFLFLAGTCFSTRWVSPTWRCAGLAWLAAISAAILSVAPASLVTGFLALQPHSEWPLRQKYVERVRQLRERGLPERARVYMIVQGDAGSHARSLRYALAPCITNPEAWSLGFDTQYPDFGTATFRAGPEWQAIIRKFDYLYLAHPSDHLISFIINLSRQAFDPQVWFYRVEGSADGSTIPLRLVPLCLGDECQPIAPGPS